MKALNPPDIARLATYVLAVALGVFMTVWGIVHNDPALVTAGLALVTTNGLAAANTPRPTGPIVVDEEPHVDHELPVDVDAGDGRLTEGAALSRVAAARARARAQHAAE